MGADPNTRLMTNNIITTITGHLVARRALTGLAGVCLVATACGSGGAPRADAADPLVHGLATAMAADSGDLLLGNIDESTCVAQIVVGGMSPDRLAGFGVTANSGFDEGDFDELGLTEQEADLLVSAFSECISVEANLAQNFEDHGNDRSEATCKASAIGGDNLLHIMRAEMVGDERAHDALIEQAVDRKDEQCA